MTEAELRAILAATEALREAIMPALPLDESASCDTALELGYVLGVASKLTFLLERDIRAKQAP